MILNLILGLLVLMLAYFAWRYSSEATALRARYSPIIWSVDDALTSARAELEKARRDQQAQIAATERECSKRELEHRLSLTRRN